MMGAAAETGQPTASVLAGASMSNADGVAPGRESSPVTMVHAESECAIPSRTSRVGKPSICFVALKAYGVLSGDPSIGHIGGAEVQQTLIGRELARRGYRVSFVVLDHGQPDAIEIDGIHVFKAYRPEAGIRGVRFFYPRLAKLWAAMRRADADIYYQRNAGAETGQVALWSRRRGRPFIYAAASDSDCDLTFVHPKRRLDRVMYLYGLRRANRVIAQTVGQGSHFRQRLGIEAEVIRSCAEIVNVVGLDQRTASALSAKPRRVLWVGRFLPVKRPEMLLELAERCPEYEFDVVGQVTEGAGFAEALLARARAMSNIILHGRVARDAMGGYLSRTAALLCTSLWEGYPNTFVEAWACGVPTVTTVDPDDVISRFELGAVGATVEALRSALMRLLEDPEQHQRCSGNARIFFKQHHTVTAAVDGYERLFSELVEH